MSEVENTTEETQAEAQAETTETKPEKKSKAAKTTKKAATKTPAKAAKTVEKKKSGKVAPKTEKTEKKATKASPSKMTKSAGRKTPAERKAIAEKAAPAKRKGTGKVHKFDIAGTEWPRKKVAVLIVLQKLNAEVKREDVMSELAKMGESELHINKFCWELDKEGYITMNGFEGDPNWYRQIAPKGAKLKLPALF